MENKTTDILHIATYSGKIFDLLNPKPEQVCIEDIAHSLAYQCRYTGHTRSFYSVAQHCVLMAENQDLPGDPIKKLLHDTDEAYLGDIAKPWKLLLYVEIPLTSIQKNYHQTIKNFELGIQDVIGLALGVDLSYSAEVKKSDIRMAATEIRDVMTEMGPDFEWGYTIDNPVKEIIVPWTPSYAEERFLSAYKRLSLERIKI